MMRMIMIIIIMKKTTKLFKIESSVPKSIRMSSYFDFFKVVIFSSSSINCQKYGCDFSDYVFWRLRLLFKKSVKKRNLKRFSPKIWTWMETVYMLVLDSVEIIYFFDIIILNYFSKITRNTKRIVLLVYNLSLVISITRDWSYVMMWWYQIYSFLFYCSNNLTPL